MKQIISRWLLREAYTGNDYNTRSNRKASTIFRQMKINKMESGKTFILLVTALLFFTPSCDDWLYIKPEDGIIRDEYWNTKEEVELAVMGCYASLLGNPSGSKGYDIPSMLFILGEIRADMLYLQKERTEFEYMFNGDVLPTNELCRWNAFYRTINYCNNVLEYADLVQEKDPSFTDEFLNQLKSEAYGLRALMYFYLVRLYSEVPLKLSATLSDKDVVYIPKSPRPEIIKQIKNDLSFAEKHITTSYSSVEHDKGRLTKYTINAIQADVYLWNEQYDSAVIACNKVINSGKYGLIKGDKEWFENLYYLGNSAESIFELQFHEYKLNPFYSLLKRNKYFMANPVAIENFFPQDPTLPPDSADIRSEGCAYKTSDGYTIWKHIAENRNQLRQEAESYAHFIIYRYSEVLLFKAEALVQMGFGEEALQLVNQVRSRAHASSLTAFLGLASDLSELEMYILEERGREFAYEGKRWFDVLRTAKRNQYENKEVVINALVQGAPSDRQVTIRAKAQDTLSHYLPIHLDELNTNLELEQNPFYE